MADDQSSQPSGSEVEYDRSRIGYWLRFIKAAKAGAKDHWKDSSGAYEQFEYKSIRNDGQRSSDAEKVPYPIYKFSCDMLEPAFFAKTPKTVAKRKFGIEDELAMTMSLIAERLTDVLIEQGNFGESMVAARGDFVQAAKSTIQIIHTSETQSYRVPLEEGHSYDGEVMSDDEGDYYVEDSDDVDESTQRLYLAPAPFDEIIHTPDAKCWPEITEMGFYFCIDRDEAERLFNKDGKKSLPYKPKGGPKALSKENREDYTDSEKSTQAPIEQLEGWECYCKHSRRKYWVCEEYTEGFLLEEDDNEEFKGFFPVPPFAIYNKHRKSMYSTPNWIYLEATSNQLNVLYTRVFDLVDSIRRRALVYGASPELIRVLNDVGGQEFISAGDLNSILEKGGIDECIQWVPVQELVQSLSECMNIEDHFKNLFQEWFGIPDIIRGTSNPNESATAQGIKADASGDRFKLLKAKMIGLARDSAEMLLDLALKVYSDKKIKRVVGFDFMSEEHQKRFEPALALLRDDRARVIHIDFETESTNFKDEERELQRQQMISTHVMQGLNAIAGIQTPEFVPIALHLLLGTLDAMGTGSSKAEDMVRSAVKQLEEARNAPQPEQPDYETMKLEIKRAEVDIKGQIAQMKQLDTAIKKQIEDQKAAIKMREIEGKEVKMQSDMQINEFTANVSAQVEKSLVALDAQRVEIERFNSQINAQEAMLEEIRLKQESDNEVLRMAVDAVQTQGVTSETPAAAPEPQIINVEQPKAPDINITVDIPKQGRKRGRMTHPDGTITEIESNTLDDE